MTEIIQSNSTWEIKTGQSDWNITGQDTGSKTIKTVSSGKKEIKERLLSDVDIADWLNYIALKATKSISTRDEWIVEVPDYKTRLDSLEKMLKIKWYYREEADDNSLDEEAIYILK